MAKQDAPHLAEDVWEIHYFYSERRKADKIKPVAGFGLTVRPYRDKRP